MNGVSTCADDGSDLNDADRAVLADPGEYGSLLIGWGVPRCSVWDVPPVPGGPLREPVSDVPVLLMDGGLDPVAPPRFGRHHQSGPVARDGRDHPGREAWQRVQRQARRASRWVSLTTRRHLPDTSCVASLPHPLAP